MTTVNLKITQEDGSKKSIQHEVEEIGIGQMQAASKVLKNVMQTLSDNPALMELFMEAVQDDGTESEDIDKRFLKMATSAFEVLFVELPEYATELLAVMSGVTKEVLAEQKLTAVLDLYDAILEENDIEKLVKRLKKSLDVTKQTMGWLRARQKATTPALH